MVKKRRQRPLPIPPRPQRRPWSREFRLQVAVVAGFVLLLVVIAGLIGYPLVREYYKEHVVLPNSKALEVGETSFDLDYFARRLKLLVSQYGLQQQPEQASAAVSLTISTLEGEELLRERAPVDLGLSVSAGDIELAIGDQLGLSESDPEAFAAALKQELEVSGLSDEEYRQMVEANLLGTRAQEVFSLSVPAAVGQVRMRQIQVATEDEASSVLERLDAGEDFGDLARELSQDTATKDEGGEKGWVAQDELDLAYGAKVFALDVGTPSQPLPGAGGYFIFEVEEKQAVRKVTDEQRSTMSSAYFKHWFDEQTTLVPSEAYVASDPDKYNWATERAFEL